MPLKKLKVDTADALTLEWILQIKDYKLNLDRKRCVGCEVCTKACPKEAIKTEKQSKNNDKTKKPTSTSIWQNAISAASAI